MRAKCWQTGLPVPERIHRIGHGWIQDFGMEGHRTGRAPREVERGAFVLFQRRWGLEEGAMASPPPVNFFSILCLEWCNFMTLTAVLFYQLIIILEQCCLLSSRSKFSQYYTILHFSHFAMNKRESWYLHFAGILSTKGRLSLVNVIKR